MRQGGRWLGGVVAVVCAVGVPTAPAGAAACSTSTGPYQRQLERHLRLVVDGRQSAQDCVAVRGFQGRQGVRPADGYAGLATYRMMLVVEAARNPNAGNKCPVRSYRVACVDLTRQLMWVQKGKRVVYKPVPVRSGRDGHETRTGWKRIYWRDRDHYSSLYDNAPMPYSQFFDGGQALHGTYGDLFAGGSHGCVNLRLADARRLWNLLRLEDAVFVYGVKPGTARSVPYVAPVPLGDPPPVTDVGPPPNPDPE
ncbi:L,D-transpeptidase [Streptomyces sp. 4F14]|uniref:L,D-transpeptidase n=1 Tax=Streptomyces sp. 4F14 TaxID=3394380 RepID=UPI003A88C560